MFDGLRGLVPASPLHRQVAASVGADVEAATDPGGSSSGKAATDVQGAEGAPNCGPEQTRGRHGAGGSALPERGQKARVRRRGTPSGPTQSDPVLATEERVVRLRIGKPCFGEDACGTASGAFKRSPVLAISLRQPAWPRWVPGLQ
jgi:hypothetical protein